MAITMSSIRPRMRLQYAVLGVVVCAVVAVIFWDGDEYEGGVLRNTHRNLGFLDSLNPTHMGIYNSSPEYTSLGKPSDINTAMHRQAPAFDASDPHDSSCDDLLLYLPDTMAHAGHGAQLNSYMLASMMATYANKAMVVMDHPHMGNDFASSSQFGCPKEAQQPENNSDYLSFPKGLSRLVKHPDWLSSKCAIPCKDQFYYKDWEAIRSTRKNSVYYPRVYTPQEIKCQNVNGRRAKVLVVGGQEVRDYFEGHFKERMLQRPSYDAHGWAMRLGAKPEQAQVFSELRDEQDIWDYVSALMARSGLLRFQPWIARDVEKYIKLVKKEILSADYDAIHVRRGDMLEDEEASGSVANYWNERGFHAPNPAEELLQEEGTRSLKEIAAPAAPHNYIPLEHYLAQYDDMECDTKPRFVYVASDDPHEIVREIYELPQDPDSPEVNMRRTTKDGCHKFHFVPSPHAFMKKIDLHIDGDHVLCGKMYVRNIVSIADMMIAAKSDMFIGEFNSNWGRVVRMFRMNLKKPNPADDIWCKKHHKHETSIRCSPILKKETRVAWGNNEPLPPGL